MDITHMLARPTATTDRIGSLAACSSAPAHGFTAFVDVGSIVTDVSGVAALTAASVAVALMDVDAVSSEAEASLVAAALPAARLEAGSEAALEVSTVVAAFTAAAVPTGVGTGNCAEACN
jgi:hypothetical protein